MTKELKWLTNLDKDEVNSFSEKCDLEVIIGDPKESEKYSQWDLIKMGMVGAYTNMEKKGKKQKCQPLSQTEVDSITNTKLKI